MADQIKNENVGEVSSPATEEKATAPQRKLPTFKNDRDTGNGDMPPRREPVIKEKERKLPVFADEVKQHEEDESDDDIDFTSDSVAMPFSFPTTRAVDVSEATTDSKEKKRKAKKAKKNEPVTETDVYEVGPGNAHLDNYGVLLTTERDKMEQFNVYTVTGELERRGDFFLVNEDEYLPNPLAYGREGYTELNGVDVTYVPTYVDENNLWERHGESKSEKLGRIEAKELLADNEAAKRERKAPKTPYRTYSVYSEEKDAFEDVLDTDLREIGRVEADALLEYYESEKQRSKKSKNEDDVDPVVVVETKDKESDSEENTEPAKAENDSTASLTEQDTTKTEKTEENNDNEQSETVYSDAEEYYAPEENDEGNTEDAPVLISTDAYDERSQKARDKREARSNRREERESLYAVAADEKQRAKDEKSAKRATKHKADEDASAVVYGDFEAYEAPEEEEAPVKEPKAKKEFSPEAYDSDRQKKADKAEAKSERKAEAAALIAVAAAEKQKAKEDKAAAKAEKKAAPAPAPEVVYHDPESEGYDPDWEAKAKEAEAKADAAEREAKKLEREGKHAEAVAKRNESTMARYEAHEDRVLRDEAEKKALLLTYKEETAKAKAEKADKQKADREARIAAANFVPPMATYDDFTETFDQAAYDADKKAEADAVAQANAEVRAAKANEKAVADAKKTASTEANYDKKTAEHIEKMERKESLLSDAKADKKEQQARKDAEYEAERAARIAAAGFVPPMAIYEDFTETFDQAAYDADKKAEADAVAQANADVRAAKANEKAEADAKKAAKTEANYDKKTAEHIEKMERKESLLSDAKADKKEQQARKDAEYEAERAARIAAASFVPPMAIYDDFTETFDQAAYDADKKAEADAVAQANADVRAAKANEKAEANAKKAAKTEANYDKKTAEHIEKMDRKESLLSDAKADKKEQQARKDAEYEAERAARIAAASFVPPMATYEDFTETFDQAAYDADKKAEADAVAQANAEVRAAKANEKAEADAKKAAKTEANYDKKTAEHIEKMDRKESLLSDAKADKKEQQARKDAEYEAERAARIAAANFVPPMAIYDDFTETFDQAAYDADKKAEADAVAQANAEVRAAKANEKAEAAAKAEEKRVAAYDKHTADYKEAVEREKEIFAHGYRDLDERKARKEAEKAAEREARIAAANFVPPMATYEDFTETFDQAAYDADKKAEADAVAQANAEVRAAKANEKAEAAANKAAKTEANYDKKTAEHIEKMERKESLLSDAKADKKEQQARKDAEYEAERAARIAAANFVPPMAIYDDFTETFDQAAYDADKKAEADAVAQANAEVRAAKANEKAEANANKSAKTESNYDKKTAEHIEKMDRKESLLSDAKADKKEQQARKDAEYEAERAARIAAANFVPPMAIYDDFTETFDQAAYDADKKAEADAVAQANAEVRAAKANEKAEADAKKAAKTEANYDKKTAEHIEKMDRKESLLSDAKADKKEQQARKDAEYEAERAARIAAANFVPPMATYEDFTETFDQAAYDADKKAEADAVAQANAEVRAAKANEKAEADAKKAAKTEANYDKKTAEHIEKMDRKESLLSDAKADKKEQQARKDAEYEAERAARIAAANFVPPMAIYDDFTETFDQAAYDADKKAEADAVAQANAEVRAAKANEKAEAAAKAEEKRVAAYDKHTADYKEAVEREKEIFAHGYRDLDERKARKEAEKAADREARIAAASFVPPMATYEDFTETFDQAAYDADKKAEADAVAQANAEVRAAKANEKAEANAKKSAKTEANYDKKTAEHIEKMERKESLLSDAKADKKEQQARKDAEYEAERAARIAAASFVPPMATYEDFTETFDQAAYDADKKAEADAVIQANAEVRAAKANEKAEANAKKSAKTESNYDKKTAEHIEKMERKESLLSDAKADKKEQQARKDAAYQTQRATRIAAASAVAPVATYADFTETFDREAYEKDKKDIAEIEAKAKADAKSAIIARKTASEAKEEARIVNLFDKTTGEQIAKMEQKADFVSFIDQANEDQKRLNAIARAKAEGARLAVSEDGKTQETVYADPEFIAAEFDMHELYEESSAKLEDVIDGKTDSLFSAEDLRRSAQNRKDQEAVELLNENLSQDEMLQFADDYDKDLKRNKKLLEKAEKYGKFMLEYGATYDPEWDGEFNNYGLPEVHPFTEGVKLSETRRRAPRRERLSGFNKKDLSKLSRAQCDTDNKMINARLEAQYADLELEVVRVQQEFSGEYRNTKEKRWLRDNKRKLKGMKARIAAALKYEKLDNERYYSVVATDFDRVELPASADRTDLVAMRDEVMRLLDIRDDINVQLIELYTGSDEGAKGDLENIKRRTKVVLKARKRAHAKYNKFYKMLSKHRVTRNEKMRIFDKMDEFVELKGEVAKIKYILRKEKPVGRAKRRYIRERKAAKKDIRTAKRWILRMTDKAIKRAKKRERRARAMFMAYTFLALIGVLAFVVILVGPQILETLKTVVPENLHKYIDSILTNWPF